MGVDEELNFEDKRIGEKTILWTFVMDGTAANICVCVCVCVVDRIRSCILQTAYNRKAIHKRRRRFQRIMNGPVFQSHGSRRVARRRQTTSA